VTRPLLGLTLLPDRDHLAAMARVIEEDAEFFEVTPETLWNADLTPNARQETILDIVRASGRPVVGHGINLSPGTPDDGAALERHLSALARDHAAFGFRWYSEHLGFVEADGLVASLPLPLPPTRDAVDAVAARVRRLAAVVPDVALENQAALFALGEPAKEPEFLNELCAVARCGLLLDLHNAFTNCRNFGIALDDWLAALDLANVVEIHVSGGSESDAAWTTSRRVFRLDSHDGDVPEDVWRALERLLPRCPNLRGVVLERNDGTLDASNVGRFEQEVRRLKALLC
jgi:uncharacterized protein (UPF0276 family)